MKFERGQDRSRKKAARTRLRDAVMPSQEELAQQKRKRLARELPKDTVRPYVPMAVRKQLVRLVEEKRTYPANAVKYLTERAHILREVEFPQELFKLDRSQLPKHTADQQLDYSPLDYMTVTYRGLSLWPLRQAAIIQRWGANKDVGEMDPIVRREAARIGMLDMERKMTKLSPEMPDVRELRGASLAPDLMGLVKAVCRCQDSELKREMLMSTLQIRLHARAERLGGTNTTDELNELAEPENLAFMCEQVNAHAGGWVEQRFERNAPVAVLGGLELKQYFQLFERDVFWYADWPEEDVRKFRESFEEELRRHLRGAIFSGVHTSVEVYARELLGAESKTRYVEMYLGKPLHQIITEEAEAEVTELLESTEYVMKDTAEGGDIPFMVEEMIHGVVDDIIKAETAEEKEPAGGKKKQDANEYSNMVRLFPEPASAPARPEPTTADNFALIMKQLTLALRFTPKEMHERLAGLARRLGELYIREITGPDFEKLRTSDLYSVYHSHSRTQDLHKLIRRFVGDEPARELIYSIEEARLGEMTDEEFASLYNAMRNNHGPAVFGKQIFSEEYDWVGVEGFRNSLPVARQRLVRLLEERPELFNDKMNRDFRKWKANQEEAERNRQA